MINGLIWTLMALGMSVAGVGGIALIARRHFATFPMLTIFLLGECARCAALFYALWRDGYTSYINVWYATQFPVIGMHVLLTAEAFRLMRKHFPGIAGFGAFVGFLFGAAAVGIAILSSRARNAEWSSMISAPLRLLRYEAFACLFFLLATVFFFSQFNWVKIEDRIQRHVFILAGLLASLIFGNLVIEMGNGAYWWAFAHQIIILGGPLACYVLWMRTVVLRPANSDRRS